MRALLFLLALGLACARPEPAKCGVTQRPIDHLYVAGRPADVRVALLETCINNNDPTFHTATSVAAEVFDPDGQPFPFTVSAPQRFDGTSVFFNSASVSFTPDRAGEWRVNTVFSPDIGRTSQLVSAIGTREDAGFRVVAAAFPAECSAYATTARGTVVCTQPISIQADLFTERGETFRADVFAIDGDVVWSVSGAGDEVRIARYQDDGSRLTLTHATLVPGDEWPTASARGDHFWMSTGRLSNGPEVHHAIPAAFAALDVTSHSFATLRVSSVVAMDDGALLFGESKTGGGPQVAWLGLDGGSFKTTQLRAGSFLGSDDGVAWFGRGSELAAATLVDGGIVEQTISFASGVGAQSRLLPTPLAPCVPIVPMFRTVHGYEDFAVARYAPEGLSIEWYGPRVVGATARHVFARSEDGKSVKVFDR